MQYELDDGEIVTLPTHFEVCPRCQGRGVHDCWEGGMTGDEMAEQGPDFFDDYKSGVYDTQCTTCQGQRVVSVVTRERVPAEILEKYDRGMQEIADMEAMEAMERRMGC